MRLKLTNVTKKFVSMRGAIIALNNVNLQIHEREFFVLLGPSGCGKSTMLNLIAGLENPTQGAIWFDGKIVASREKRIFLSPKQRNVAMVFQNYALYPHLNVFENIAFPLRIARTKENIIKESVEKISSTLGISTLLSAKPRELSGGQQQRVAIARAIVRKPDFFLLDEPLSNLDAQLRAATRIELKKIQRNLSITTIYVTHDQVEAMTLGDRVAVLNDGKIEQIGTPQALYERPVNTFVATFIGSPPMNLLETSIIKEQGKLYIIIDNKRLPTSDITSKNMLDLKPGTYLLGIRPEHIQINPTTESNIFKAKIDSIELLVRELLLHILMHGLKLSVLTNNTKLKKGQTVDLAFDLKKAHIFEA
jgi:multiple sugar transport system ATP-binding protein